MQAPPPVALWTVALAVAGWALLAWIAVDMDSTVAQLTMPAGPDWDAANLLAICAMWTVMMAAMMLPSALPMIVAFVDLDARRGEHRRSLAFVAAYLLVWLAFSAAATASQWALLAAGWVSPMIEKLARGGERLATLLGAVLIIAGIWRLLPVA